MSALVFLAPLMLCVLVLLGIVGYVVVIGAKSHRSADRAYALAVLERLTELGRVLLRVPPTQPMERSMCDPVTSSGVRPVGPSEVQDVTAIGPDDRAA